MGLLLVPMTAAAMPYSYNKRQINSAFAAPVSGQSRHNLADIPGLSDIAHTSEQL
jgi:hypothetical protein